MRRRRAVVSLAVVAVLLGWSPDLRAHAGVRASMPVDGATLGDGPTAIQLWFSERPEGALSEIRVADVGGATYQIGRPEAAPGDPLSLTIRVRPMPTGVFTVTWRIVSAVDGHVTAGAYAFGVKADPTGASAATGEPAPISGLEILARWMFLVGLLVLMGAATVGLSGAGARGAVTLSAVASGVGIGGVVLLAFAQRQQADVAWPVLLGTSVGHALIQRAVAIAAAGGALLGARFASPRVQAMAHAGALAAALAGAAAHVAAGHAAATGGWLSPAVAAQWSHVAGAGIWLGGLAAMLTVIRGAPTSAKGALVRRMSTIAAFGLAVVSTTAVARALGELTAWRDLVSTTYGSLIAIKVLLLASIAGLGAINRFRHVASAVDNLRPLRRTVTAELGLAVVAVAASAILATTAPPAAVRAASPGIDVSAVDFGTTVRVRLSTASPQAGPNRFVVHVTDYDTDAPVLARRVSLTFSPLDDPGVPPTTLALAPASDGSFVGSGANLAFEGRWSTRVLVEKDAGSVHVAIEFETRGPAQSVSIQRTPGQTPLYTVEVRGLGVVRFAPDPERAGRSTVLVTCFTVIYERCFVDELVVTAGAGSDPMRPVPVRRLDRGKFAAEVEFRPGANRLAAIARPAGGARLRAVLNLTVPRN